MSDHPVVRPALTVLAHIAAWVGIAIFTWDIWTVRLPRVWGSPALGPKITMTVQFVLIIVILVVAPVVHVTVLLRWFHRTKGAKGTGSDL